MDYYKELLEETNITSFRQEAIDKLFKAEVLDREWATYMSRKIESLTESELYSALLLVNGVIGETDKLFNLTTLSSLYDEELDISKEIEVTQIFVPKLNKFIEIIPVSINFYDLESLIIGKRGDKLSVSSLKNTLTALTYAFNSYEDANFLGERREKEGGLIAREKDDPQLMRERMINAFEIRMRQNNETRWTEERLEYLGEVLHRFKTMPEVENFLRTDETARNLGINNVKSSQLYNAEREWKKLKGEYIPLQRLDWTDIKLQTTIVQLTEEYCRSKQIDFSDFNKRAPKGIYNYFAESLTQKGYSISSGSQVRAGISKDIETFNKLLKQIRSE
jgi:hypothetical protein